MSDVTIDISANSNNAADKITAISKALVDLKKSASGSWKNLSSVARGLNSVAVAANSVQANSVGKIYALSDALKDLSKSTQGVGSGRLKSALKALKELDDAVGKMEGNYGNISKVARAFGRLSDIKLDKSNTNALSRLPKIIEKFGNANMEHAITQFTRAANALDKLSIASERYAKAYASVPKAAWNYTGIRKFGTAATSSESSKTDDFFASLWSIGKKGISIASLATAISKVSSVALKAFGNVANGALRVSAAFLTAGMSSQTFRNAISNAFSSIVSNTVPVIEQCVNAINEYVESLNMARTVMGSSYFESMAGTLQNNTFKGTYDIATGQGTGFWVAAENAMNISSAEAVKYQAIFESMMIGMGSVNEEAEFMSQQLTQLGYDLSSLMNSDIETAMLKIRSGIGGELEPLRQWGFDLSEARLQLDATTLGINKSIESMTQAEKVSLRYYEMITQLSHAHGDLARTINSPANLMRSLTAQVGMLARDIGALLLPVIKAVLVPLAVLVKLLRDAVQAIAFFFGVNLSESFADLSTVSSGMSGVSDAADDAAESANGAAKAAKEWKKQLLGFDEINNLSPQTESGGGSGGGVGAGGGGFSVFDYGYDFFSGLEESLINKLYTRIKYYIDKKDFLGLGRYMGNQIRDGLRSIDWKKIQTEVYESVKGIAETISGVFSSTGLGFEIGRFAGELINTFNISILSFLSNTRFGSIGRTIGEAIGTALSTIDVNTLWRNFIYGVNGFASAFYEAMNGFISSVDMQEFGEKWGSSITKFFSMIKLGDIGEALGGVVNSIVDYIYGVFITLDADTVADSLISFFDRMFKSIDWEKLGKTISEVIGKLWEIIRKTITSEEFKTGLSNAFTDVISGIFSGPTIAQVLSSIGDSFVKVNPTMGTTNWVLDALGLGNSLSFSGILDGFNRIIKSLNRVETTSWSTARSSDKSFATFLNDLGIGFSNTSSEVTNGLMSMSESAESSSSNMSMNISKAWESFYQNITGASSSVKLKVAKDTASVTGDAYEISNAFSTAASDIKKNMSSKLSSVKYDFESVSSKATTEANKIKSAFKFRFDFSNVKLPSFSISPAGWTGQDLMKGQVPKLGLSWNYYATGGFPEVGEMFIARENGVPEMIGSMGGKNTVANNEQIVAGIAAGVSAANAEQNALISEQNSLLRRLLEKETGFVLDGKMIAKSINHQQRIQGRRLVEV